MSTITDSQHQEVTSSQPLFSQQDDSQNTQSSTSLSQFRGLADFIANPGLTPEDFKNLNSQGTPHSADSLFASQRSSQRLSNRSSQRSSERPSPQVFMGFPDANLTDGLEAKGSPSSIPSSQLSGYSNEATRAAKLVFPETPITSQEDDDHKTPTASQALPHFNAEAAAEQMEDDLDDEDTEVEDNQPMEPDDEADKTSDFEQENLISSTSGKHGPAFGHKLISPGFQKQPDHALSLMNKNCGKAKQLNLFNAKQQCIAQMNYEQAVNGCISIGKSNEMISRMEACQGSYAQLDAPNYGNNRPFPVKSIGKSENNFGMYLDQCQYQQQQPVAYGKQQLMETQYSKPTFDSPGFGAYQNPNFAGKGKLPPSQYSGKQQFYGKVQPPNCAQMYPHTSKAMANHETSSESYMLTDLDDCQAKPAHGKSIGKNYQSSPAGDCFGRSALNLSRSSSPVSYDEMFNEDSNDSLAKKRKKASGLQGQSEQLTKVTKVIDDEMKKNSEIQSQEVKSLSQQFDRASLGTSSSSKKRTSNSSAARKSNSSVARKSNGSANRTLNKSASETAHENSFDIYEEASDYWTKNSSAKPSFIGKSQSQVTRKSSASGDSSMLENCLNSLDRSIETPRKTAGAYGPIQKPVPKTAKKTRGKKKSEEANTSIKRTPVNIFEPAKPAKPSSSKSDGRASTAKEKAAKEKVTNEKPSRSASTRSVRERAPSFCSSKSVASDEDDDQSLTEDESKLTKEERRKLNNKKSAREYRQRQKAKEEKLDQDIAELTRKRDELKKELRKVLVKKHVYMSAAIEDGGCKLPEWAKNSANLEDCFLSQ